MESEKLFIDILYQYSGNLRALKQRFLFNTVHFFIFNNSKLASYNLIIVVTRFLFAKKL